MRAIVPRLMLERVERRPQKPRGVPIVLLHDGEGRPDHLGDLVAALTRSHVVVPRAPRWAGSRGPGLYNWFTSPAAGVVDPVGFSDSLTQLEMLVQQMAGLSASRRIGAVGFGQGATIAATLAALWPERFAWLVLVGGFWVDLPEDMLPMRAMGRMPVLVGPGREGWRIDGAALANRGASVTATDHAGTDLLRCIRAWARSLERETEGFL